MVLCAQYNMPSPHNPKHKPNQQLVRLVPGSYRPYMLTQRVTAVLQWKSQDWIAAQSLLVPPHEACWEQMPHVTSAEVLNVGCSRPMMATLASMSPNKSYVIVPSSTRLSRGRETCPLLRVM